MITGNVLIVRQTTHYDNHCPNGGLSWWNHSKQTRDIEAIHITDIRLLCNTALFDNRHVITCFQHGSLVRFVIHFCAQPVAAPIIFCCVDELHAGVGWIVWCSRRVQTKSNNHARLISPISLRLVPFGRGFELLHIWTNKS